MKDYHIAVLDIGKTNKKIFIYDAGLREVHREMTQIPEIEEETVLLDDVKSLKSCILKAFSSLSGKFNIKVIATSAHGATYALLDDKGQAVVPQVAYNTDPGDDLHRQFYELCGDPVALQKATATPNFNLLINPAKGIYFSRLTYPEKFKKVRQILFYPQLFAYWLTGQACADVTYVGNHTYLWDFHKNDWSEVVDRLSIREMLPKSIKNPWERVGVITPEIARQTGLDKDVIVTAGIHDSNASLLPYLIKMKKPFMLNSTGTWCVIMKEQEEVKFSDDELGKVVFYNQNAFGKPLKTAIFLGGLEYDFYSKILSKIHGRDDVPVFKKNLYQRIVDEKRYFILPSIAKGIGQFPESDARIIENGQVVSPTLVEKGEVVPGFFNNYEVAHAVLNLSLAIQTKVSLDRTGILPGTEVFTEGGFSQNEAYNMLMTALFPENDFYLTSLREATAFGAALTGKAAIEQKDIRSLAQFVNVSQHAVHKCNLPGVRSYLQKFLSLI